MIRIKDIADRAGVSPTTVSNVIHGRSGRVSKETIDRINAILQEMEYVPSISARMLANSSSGLIGVVIGFHKKGTAFSLEDPFVAALLGNLEYQIREKGYYMMLVTRHDRREILEQAMGWNFDGIIAIGLKDREIQELHANFPNPVVAIDQYFEEPQDVVSVIMDDIGGAYQMGKYLTEKGHRRILFVSDNDRGVDHYRWQGVKKALEEAGIKDCEKRHLLIPWDPIEREKRYRELLPYFREQSALFFSSDYYALEASNFLQNQGVRVPEEISIAGFDDVTYALLARPRLTTVHQMVDEKAKRALDTILCMIKGEPIQNDGKPIPTRIVERESVREIREDTSLVM
ncbi:MAG: LacI family DNA-binding transcriptional regulator [Fusicatenibacter sp.]